MPERRDASDDKATEGQYRFRQGWSSSARLSASSALRAAISGVKGLVPVCETASEALLDIFQAHSVSVTLMNRDEYLDIVNVGWLEPGQARLPQEQRYPTSTYPAATRRLLQHEGYISTDTQLDVVREYIDASPFNRMGCFMGVPIVAAGEVLGEIFLWRDADHPPFSAGDLPVAYDLATQFGAQLPGHLRQLRLQNPDW